MSLLTKSFLMMWHTFWHSQPLLMTCVLQLACLCPQRAFNSAFEVCASFATKASFRRTALTANHNCIRNFGVDNNSSRNCVIPSAPLAPLALELDCQKQANERPVSRVNDIATAVGGGGGGVSKAMRTGGPRVVLRFSCLFARRRTACRK
jgi:hypothetical protein